MNNRLILRFLVKFLCLFKAASEGWIVTYIGGNKYEFSKLKKIHDISLNTTLQNYISTLTHILKI